MAADRVFGIVFVLVLAAEADETRQTMTFLIACLVGIAIALTLLTVWYWFYTDPRRQRGSRRAVSPLIDAVEGPAPQDKVSRSDAPKTGPDDLDTADPDREAVVGSTGSAVVDDGETPAEDFVVGPIVARQTWDFVAAAERAENDGPRVDRSTSPASPRIAVPDRSAVPAPTQGDADELAVVRRRRELEAARGLTDEVWSSVRRSVFDKLDE